MKDKSENIILNKSFDFACDILDLNELLNDKKHYVLAKQVIRSGTSIGANIKESQRAVSRKDFVYKLETALKEADETEFWFALIDKKVFKLNDKLKSDLQAIISILVSIINTTKGN